MTLQVPSQNKRKGKIIIFVGLPASGKSTRARELMEDGNVMRVNRDEIRAMLFKKWKGKKEHVVTQIEKASIRSAIADGYDIIVDDTNLNPSTRASWENLALELGVSVVEESFETPIDTCVLRDSLRTGKAHVGRAIIENMALRYNLLPKPAPEQKVVIFDIDGTLADSDERAEWLNVCKVCKCKEPKHHLTYVPPGEISCYTFIAGGKDHEKYFQNIDKDKPVVPVIKWAQACYAEGDYVLVVSGRPTDVAGDATVRWLQRYGVDYKHLFMRAGGDYRDDTIIKQEILDKILKWLPKEQIAFAVDDRPRVIRMWKSNGIKCFDVGKGVEF